MGLVLDIIGLPFGRIADWDLRWYRDLNLDPTFLDSISETARYDHIEESLERSDRLAERYSKILREESYTSLVEQFYSLD